MSVVGEIEAALDAAHAALDAAQARVGRLQQLLSDAVELELAGAFTNGCLPADDRVGAADPAGRAGPNGVAGQRQAAAPEPAAKPPPTRRGAAKTTVARERAVLDAITENGVSKDDLIRATGMTREAVSYVIQRLAKQGLIRSEGFTQARRFYPARQAA